MRQEQKRQIQEAVLNSMAPAYTGQVSLEDVARAFTGRGSVEEIEECLDDLAKQGRAEKTVVMGRTYYVFQSIAGEAASRNEKRLVEIQKELDSLSRDEETTEQLLNQERDALDLLRPIWLNGFDLSDLESSDLQKIQNYTALMINKPLQEKTRRLLEIQSRIQELKSQRDNRKAWKEDSFLILPAKT